MKSILVNLAALAAIVAATVSCADPSPEVTVSCGTIDDVNATFGTGGGVQFFFIHKFISIEDQALGTTTPGRDLNVSITANAADINPAVAGAAVCEGSLFANCDTVAEYQGRLDTETTEDGFLEYFLMLQATDGGQSEANSVTEVIGSSLCETNYSFTSAGP